MIVVVLLLVYILGAKFLFILPAIALYAYLDKHPGALKEYFGGDPDWFNDGLDRFLGYYYAQRTNRYEKMCVGLLNEFVDSGTFAEAHPDWLVAQNVSTINNPDNSTVTLELDGYNPVGNICFEYQGIVHYEYKDGGDRNINTNSRYAKWMRQRTNDKIKSRIVRERGYPFIIIAYNVHNLAPGTKPDVGFAARYAKYVISRLHDINRLKPLPGADESRWADSTYRREYLSKNNLYMRVIPEPQMDHKDNVEVIANRNTGMVVEKNVFIKNQKRAAAIQMQRNNAALKEQRRIEARLARELAERKKIESGI